MLTRSWGSWRTMRTLIPPAPGSPSAPAPADLPAATPIRSAAPDELPRPSHSAGEHLVNDKVETDPAPDMRAVPIGPGDRQRDAVAALRAPPGALDAVGNARRPTGGSDPHAASVLPFGHDQPASDVAAFQIAQVQLQPVRVNLVGLVVEPQRRRVGGAETQVRLRHLYGEVERLVVPAGIGD